MNDKNYYELQYKLYNTIIDQDHNWLTPLTTAEVFFGMLDSIMEVDDTLSPRKKITTHKIDMTK